MKPVEAAVRAGLADLSGDSLLTRGEIVHGGDRRIWRHATLDWLVDTYGRDAPTVLAKIEALVDTEPLVWLALELSGFGDHPMVIKRLAELVRGRGNEIDDEARVLRMQASSGEK